MNSAGKLENEDWLEIWKVRFPSSLGTVLFIYLNKGTINYME